MFVFLYKWIRRLAQCEARPLHEPSIGTRGTLEFFSAREKRDFTSLPRNLVEILARWIVPNPL